MNLNNEQPPPLPLLVEAYEKVVAEADEFVTSDPNPIAWDTWFDELALDKKQLLTDIATNTTDSGMGIRGAPHLGSVPYNVRVLLERVVVGLR